MKTAFDKASIPVVILCGGMGTRLSEETETKPKPLVEIGGRPILWHIMKTYAHHGFKNFILCLGYKGHLIRDYFLNYEYKTRDLCLHLGGKNGGGTKVEFLDAGDSLENWTITFADTGQNSLTGSRVKQIEKYVKSDHFFLTYGDGVSDVNVSKVLDYHLSHGKIGTVTGVTPPSRFGELMVEQGNVIGFKEKPDHRMSESEHTHFINGGYCVFRRDFFKYVSADAHCVLEREPFEKLTKDNQFMMHKHSGFWHCMDTMRDLNNLRELWDSGNSPWKVW